MGIVLADAIAFERDLLGTPASGPSGANSGWSDAQLTRFTNNAVRHIVGRIFFPDSRVTFQTQLNQQLYPIPEMHRIYRVYANGQPYSLGSKDLFEGNQIGIFDQSGNGTPPAGSDAPPGAGGQMQPQWTIATPTSEPFLNSWGSPAPSAAPFAPGQRGRYYLTSGCIGLVPMPQPGAWVTIDCVAVPDLLSGLQSQIIVPSNFLDAIGWKVCEYAFTRDDSDRASAKRREVQDSYMNELRILRTWSRQYSMTKLMGPFPRTYQSYFKFGGHRVGSVS